jgi:hypothetical protein
MKPSTRSDIQRRRDVRCPLCHGTGRVAKNLLHETKKYTWAEAGSKKHNSITVMSYKLKGADIETKAGPEPA